MLSAVESPCLVPFGDAFDIRDAPTVPPAGTPGKKAIREEREALTARLRDQQQRLYEQRWKFSLGDLEESEHRDSYQSAFQDALSATSKAWAPRYAILADDKRYMRLLVTRIVVGTLESMGLDYPTGDRPSEEEIERVRSRSTGKQAEES